MTEKLNQIEQGLLRLGPAEFESLCREFLIRRYPETKATIQDYGKKIGANKVKTGFPDKYFKTTSSKYAFVECNTQQDRVFKKLKEDLTKCFETGIPDDEIEIIFLFYTGRTISPEEDKLLKDFTKEKGVVLELIGIDILKTYLRIDYQILAEIYLGISVDSGQIIDKSSFLQTQSHNKFSTGFEQKLVGREKEVDEILTALQSNSILVLSGIAGVGKTKLAIECLERWCSVFSGYTQKFISPKSGALREEISFHFEVNTNYIILVDDAFRLEDLERLIFFNQDRKNDLKLILTVRDSSLNKIHSIFRHFSLPNPKEIKIEKISNEQIIEILKSEGVTYSTCYYKIARLVNGNPRLALMAAKRALKNNNCNALNDVSDIYDEYFRPYILDKNIDKENFKILGILSAFKVIRYNDVEIHDQVENAFGYSKNQIWDGVIKLHENELVDFNDSNTLDLARIVDQTLASYIFYQVFIEQKLLDLSKLIQYSFKKNKGRFRDALRPILDSYGFEKISNKLKPMVDAARSKIEEDDLFDFYYEFAFCQEYETIIFLNYICNKAEAVPFDESYLKNDYYSYFFEGFKIIELARKLNHNAKCVCLASQIVLKYLIKQPKNLKEGIKYFLEDVYFHADDYDAGYQVQIKLFEVLLKEVTKENDCQIIYKLLLKAIAGKYLQIIAKGIKPRGNNSYENAANIYIGDITEWVKKRKEIWEYFSTLIDTDFNAFKTMFETAIETGRYPNIESILLNNEAEFVIGMLNSKLNSDILEHNIIAHKYLEFLGHCNIKTNKFKSFFENNTTLKYRHFRILTFNYSNYSRRLKRKEKRLDYKEIPNLIEKYLLQKTKNYSIENYLELFQSYSEAWYIDRNIFDNPTFILLNLFEKSPENFKIVIENLFAAGNKCLYVHTNILEKLFILFEGQEETLWQFIDRYEFEKKADWQLMYLLSIPEHLISNKNYERLRHCITLINYLVLFGEKLNKINKYDSILKNGGFVEIFSIIQRRCSKKVLEFHGYDLVKNFSFKFENHLILLKKLYFHSQKDKGLDQNGEEFQILLNLDKDFLTDYLKYCFPNKFDDERVKSFSGWAFIWERDDYEVLIEQVINFFTIKQNIHKDNDNFLKNIFTAKGDKESRYKIINLLKLHIKNNLSNEVHLNLIFKVVVNCFPNELVDFFRYLFQNTDSYEIFASLPTKEEFGVFINTSRSDIFLKERSIWNELNNALPLDINFMNHRTYILRQVEWLNNQIEYQKKEEFWRDY